MMAFILPGTTSTNAPRPSVRLTCPKKILRPSKGVISLNAVTFRCVSAHNHSMPSSYPGSTDRHSNKLFQHYESSLQNAREKMTQRTFFTEAMSMENTQALPLAFLLFICSRGVRLTKPVEDWLTRTADACRERGFYELAHHFREHAGEEKGHNLMFESDTRRLAARWNAKFPHYPLSADNLLAADFLTPGERAFISLHETSIASDTPFCTLPIVYEIERLAVSLAPPLVNKLVGCVGDGVENDLSFLQHHMHHDVHHRQENEQQLRRVLCDFEEHREIVARTGGAALEAYGDHLDDCFVLASATVADMTLQERL